MFCKRFYETGAMYQVSGIRYQVSGIRRYGPVGLCHIFSRHCESHRDVAIHLAEFTHGSATSRQIGTCDDGVRAPGGKKKEDFDFKKMKAHKKSRPVFVPGRLECRYNTLFYCSSCSSASVAGVTLAGSASSVPFLRSRMLRYLRRPVPAGMSLPTMTFSFRPAR